MENPKNSEPAADRANGAVGAGEDVAAAAGAIPLLPELERDWRTATQALGGPSRCPHCRNWIGNNDEQQQTQHVLNGCPRFQNRFEWRQAAVLNYLLAGLEGCRDLTVFADLPDRRTDSGGTVPEELLSNNHHQGATAISSLKPGIVFFSRSYDSMAKDCRFVFGLVEVTIPWDHRVEAAREEKRQMFAPLVAALSERTKTPVRFISIEVGSFKQRLSEGTRSGGLKELYSFTDKSVSFKAFRTNLVRLVEYASFLVYKSRHEPDFAPLEPLLGLPASLAFGDEDDDDDHEDNVSSGSSEPTSSSSLSDHHHHQRVVDPENQADHHVQENTSESQALPEEPPDGTPEHLPLSDEIQSSDNGEGDTTAATTIQQDPNGTAPPPGKVCAVSTTKVSPQPKRRQEAVMDPPVSIGWKTKAVMYGSVASLIGYIIYNYWHIILLTMVALGAYEVWDFISTKKKN